MEMLRSGFQAVGLSSGDSDNKGGAPSSAETIERLVSRLNTSTLLEDRRDACRALKAMSRKYRVEVGVQALDCMIEILKSEDRNDEEIVGYSLDTLANICSPDEFEEEIQSPNDQNNAASLNSSSRSAASDVSQGCHGEQFTEIYLKREENVQCVIDVLEDYDFRVRRPAIKLLTYLLLNKPRRMQDVILGSRMGVSRLMDVLVDSREVLRNDALILMIQLTKGNSNLQKIVAFENAFDKIVDIVEVEGYSDGGIVVEDCLRLMLNLLRNNSSNQTFFREGSYIQRISSFFELDLDQDEIEVGWSAQKVSNMLHMLQVVRTLVSPSNSTQVTNSCQITIQQCGLLEKLCSTLMASGIPADILTETINALSETIRGHQANQIFFQNVHAPSVPPRPALILLLMSMVNEKQPFALRCAVLYCFQCYLHKNPLGQKDVMQTLFPDDSNAENTTDELSGGFPAGVITAGQLLCGGLFSNDRLSNWFSAVALAHGLIDQEEIKVGLLRVQLSTSTGNEPVSLLQQCVSILQQSSNLQTRFGLLMLLCSWTTKCQPAVAALLSIQSVIPYLTGQIGSNEHDEMERLAQGVCAFLLGLSITHNDNTVANCTQEKLLQLVEKRIGVEIFMDKLSEISKHEAYNRALKHPQLKCQDASELVFDNKFCAAFKLSEHAVINKLEAALSQQEDSGERAIDPGVLLQYKDLIREQDQRINEISRANIYLQQELINSKQQLEETKQHVQELQDKNSLLKTAQQVNGGLNTVVNGQGTSNIQSESEKIVNNQDNDNLLQTKVVKLSAQLEKSEQRLKMMDVDLKARDSVISELETRIASSQITSSNNSHLDTNGISDPVKIEVETMRQQLNALQFTIAKRDEQIEQLNAQLLDQKTLVIDHELTAKHEELKTSYDALQTEQDDLLIMLSDQDNKLEKYKHKLRELGHCIASDEEDIDDNELL